MLTHAIETAQPTEVEECRMRVSRICVRIGDHVRKFSQLGWALALACAIAAIVAGVWCAFLSWKISSPKVGMLAVLLVLAAPALTVALIVARPDAPAGAGFPLTQGRVILH